MTRLLVYDGDCGFCTRWALRIARHSDVDLRAFSDVDADLEARLPSDWRECAHLVLDDRVLSCGAAMEAAYAHTDLPLSGAVPYLRNVPGYPTLRERGYRWIADHRELAGRLSP